MTFAIACVAILVMGATVFIGCSKEDSNSDNLNGSQILKSESAPNYDEYFANSMSILDTIHLACCNAYQNDNTSLLDACNANDAEKFFSLIGFTEDEIISFQNIISEEYDNFIADYPEYEDTDEDYCSDCVEKGLSVLGDVISTNNGNPDVVMFGGPGCVRACTKTCKIAGSFWFPCFVICMLLCN